MRPPGTACRIGPVTLIFHHEAGQPILNGWQPVCGGSRLQLHITTLRQLEGMAAVSGGLGTLTEVLRFGGQFDMVDEVYPADGLFLLTDVAKPMQALACKMLTGLRSYEYVMKVQFATDTLVTVMLQRQQDYAKLHKERIKAQSKR